MEASLARFKVSSIPEERVEEIRKKVKDQEDRGLRGHGRAVHIPARMTPDLVRAIQDAIGDGYFAQTITSACLAAQQGLAVTVPFSSAASRPRGR
ncbi:MAG: hypothetical protein IPM08_17485 [Actinomycetales bacterium]|nr:hypothetical protein [Actinomycetales bacterium]